MNLPGRKVPKKPAVHRAQADVICRLSLGLDLLEEPTRFACRKQRVNCQPGSLSKKGLQALLTKVLAKVRRAPALPDHGWAQRAAGEALPRENCLTLVGNSDRRELVRGDLADAGADDGFHCLPNCKRILLYPSRMRKRNLHRHRGPRHDSRLAIDDDGLGVRRALVNG